MNYPLEHFFTQLNQTHVNDNYVTTDFSNFSRNQFKNQINNFPNMDQHSLALLIKNNLDVISEDIINNDADYIPLLVDVNFISAFIRAVSSVPISYTLQLCCNKIMYDYNTIKAEERSTYVNPEVDRVLKDRYKELGRIANKEAISKLIAIGIPENLASIFAMCRYSSVNEKTNVKRLNFAIYNTNNPELMDEQMVVWIYEKLFSRISDLFQATMFEVYNNEQMDDFGENFAEIYGTVSLVVLTILNNMTSENIRKVLIGYSEEWEYAGRPLVRFSLHALSGDYSRITRVVDYMTNDEGRSIP